MAKGRNKKEKSQGNVPHREMYHRMNFLYQASRCLSQIHYTLPCQPSEPIQPAKEVPSTKRQLQTQKHKSPIELASFYNQTLKSIAKRLVIRADPNVKRTICKGCQSPQVEGETCTSRIKGRKNQEKFYQVKCNQCGNIKRLLINPHHILFNDQSEQNQS